MKLISKEWLNSAKSDLLLIEQIISKDYLTHMVAFHCQQCVEKSLKALLEHYEEKIPKIHSINKLYDLNKNRINVDDLTVINLLDELYIESRYPGDFGLLPNGKPTIQEAQKFFDFAKLVYGKVRSLVNGNR